MSRIPRPPSTAQRLGLFREECRKYYASLRNPEQCKSRTEPDPKLFKLDPFAMEMAENIKSDEKAKHEKIMKGVA